MRDFLLLTIILGSVPICFMNPYFGVLMWYWVTYFNPHRFTWGIAYNFPVALVVAAPTLAGLIFTRKSLRSLGIRESLMLMLLWIWFAFTYIHAQAVPLFAGNMADAAYEMSHVSKILLITFATILVVTTRERLRGVMLVTAGSLGLLAVKSALFGIQTGGEARVWGPPDSFISDNNAFGLTLVMSLPLLFFLARDQKARWMRTVMRVIVACVILVVLLTYSRGALLGLLVVLTAIMLKSRHKIVAALMIAAAFLLVLTFAPPAWMNRMGQFVHGQVDSSADERLISWGTAWNFSRDYPLTGGSFDVLPNVDVFQRYQPRPLPMGFLSSAPHSIYFQLLADQGFPGLGLFLLLMVFCFWSLWRLRRRARAFAPAAWLVNYTHMVEISILGFLVSGAFLGFVYLDVIYQMVAMVVIMKTLFKKEVATHAVQMRESIDPPMDLAREEVPALA